MSLYKNKKVVVTGGKDRDWETWTDKINKDLLQKAENHAKEKKEIKEHYEKELAEVNKLYEEAVETNREIVEINRDAINLIGPGLPISHP